MTREATARKADDMFEILGPDDFDQLRAFYFDVIDLEHQLGDRAGWIKDVYPSPDVLRERLAAGEFYAHREDGRIAAAMVVNENGADGYDQADWPVACAQGEYLVPHMLAVAPAFRGQGLARACVRKVVELAREQGKKAIRLDVLAGNDPAEQLYLSEGFYFVKRLPLYYEDTGWTDYLLYEYDMAQA